MSLAKIVLLLWLFVAVFAAVTFLVVVPYEDCARAGGLPVAGVGRIVCAQPFKP